MLMLWSETVKYDLEMFSITNFYPEGNQFMGSCCCRESVFICLLLPAENVIIYDKCLSKCEQWEKLNDLRFYYILRFY